MKLTEAKRRYLEAVDDWSAAWEVAAKLGLPNGAGNKVKPYLGRLIGEGFVTWSRANATYRITAAGRKALECSTPPPPPSVAKRRPPA